MHSSSLPASDLIVPKDTMSFSERDWSALEAEKTVKSQRQVLIVYLSRDQWGTFGQA